MEVIPVINCEDRACAEKKLKLLATFLPRDRFVHVDVADGVFAFHKTWNDPRAWRTMNMIFPLEAHLMVEHPTIWIEPWLAAGVKRFIVHVEALDETRFKKIKALCDRAGATLMLSSDPETPVDAFSPYCARVAAFQVLCVNPGLAGQPLLPVALEKIEWLRRHAPHAIIEVDGGMNLETAKLAKDVGADIIVSSSDIFDNEDPRGEYERLRKI